MKNYVDAPTRLPLFLILGGLVVFLSMLIFLIQIPDYSFNFPVNDFLRSVVLCLPFMAITLFLDYKFVVYFNNSLRYSKSLWIRIICEGFLTILLALTVLVIGNLPFKPIFDIPLKSIIISVLFNSFAVLLIEFYIHNRNSHELQEEYIKIQYRQLKSQINPHFLFNSLNALVSLINKDSDRASEYVKKLSEVYRYVLRVDTKDLVSLEAELDFIQNYLEILILRFGKGLIFQIDMDKKYLTGQIPPMTLQLLVENAVKHNIITQKEPLVIRIYTKNGNIYVSNSINPRTYVHSSNGIGLNNLSEKYQFLANKEIAIQKDKTCFNVTLPVL